MRDAEMDNLIRKMLSARASGRSKPCMNENLMAAYIEGNLSPLEMTEFEIHLADCASCREVLALSMKLEPKEHSTHPVVMSNTKRTLFHFSIPIPVLGALVLAAVLIPAAYIAVKQADDRQSGTQVADVRSPVRQTESPSAPAASVDAPEPEKSPMRQRMQAEKPILERKGKLPEDANLGMQSHAPAMRGGAAGALKAESSPAAPPMKADAEIPAQDVDRQDKLAEAAPPPVPAAERPVVGQLPDMSLNQVNSFRAMPSVNAAPPNEMLLGSDKDAIKFKTAESKQIRDKVFYRNAGMWIDRQCTEHRDQAIIEILPVAPEHESILASYPELKSLLPVVIYWNNTNYLLR